MEQFAAPPDHYDRFMGRYSEPLAVELADAAGVDAFSTSTAVPVR